MFCRIAILLPGRNLKDRQNIASSNFCLDSWERFGDEPNQIPEFPQQNEITLRSSGNTSSGTNRDEFSALELLLLLSNPTKWRR
jgi:hypothetical protein